MFEARVEYQADGTVALECPYDKEFIEEMKRVVSPGNRTWDPEAKLWYLNEYGWRAVRPWIEDFFVLVE